MKLKIQFGEATRFDEPHQINSMSDAATNLCAVPALRKKCLRQRIREMSPFDGASKVRRTHPLTCFRVIGVPGEALDPIGRYSFDIAKLLWVKQVAKAREMADLNWEKAINVAWQHLKNWRCPVCGGLKKRTRDETCGPICGRNASANAIRQRNGAIILRMSVRNRDKFSGRSYRGNKLREAQLECLQRALVKHAGNVSATARHLGLSRSVCQYYIRKFGGLGNGLPWKSRAD